MFQKVSSSDNEKNSISHDNESNEEDERQRVEQAADEDNKETSGNRKSNTAETMSPNTLTIAKASICSGEVKTLKTDWKLGKTDLAVKDDKNVNEQLRQCRELMMQLGMEHLLKKV